MSAKTGAIVRDLGYVAWKDPRAWMEDMRGPRWKARVRAENDRFEGAVEATGAEKEEVEAVLTSFEAAAQEAEVVAQWTAEAGTTRIRVLPQSGGVVNWMWDREGATEADMVLAGDVDLATEGIVAYTRDAGKGGEAYELVVQRRDRKLWSTRGRAGRGTGSTVAIVGSRVLYLEAEGPLRYVRVMSASLLTGRDRRVLYEEKDRSRALSLSKGERGCLFVISENSGRQQLFVVEEGGMKIRQLCPEGICFFPVGYAPGSSSDPCFLVRRGSFTAPWDLEGEPLRKWKLDTAIRKHGVDAVVLACGLIVHRNHGERYLTVCSRRKAVRQGVGMFAEVAINPWARWEGRVGVQGEVEMVVTAPGAAPCRGVFRADTGLALQPPTSIYGGRRLVGQARSQDGAIVRWIMAHDKNRPRPEGLIVVGYGAYGVPTTFSTARWKPYLERGFAVGIALVRGGGDHNEEWVEAGRREGKLRGVMDFEACVRAMREVLRMPADRTVVFGRSAGGYLVGAAVVRNPGGRLFGHVYTEVPYTDVLRTASNPTLPLTEYEYLEFGDPAARIQDLEVMLRLGPVTGLGPEGAPGVSVLCRTAENDTQVYAYEAVKWVDALRGEGGEKSGAPKLLALTGGQGHFTRGKGLYVERAEDYLILCRNILR